MQKVMVLLPKEVSFHVATFQSIYFYSTSLLYAVRALSIPRGKTSDYIYTMSQI